MASLSVPRYTWNAQGLKKTAISSFAAPTLINKYRSFLKKWEPFGSPFDLHLALVKLVDMLHSAKEFKKIRVVQLSIIEGDLEVEHSMP